MKAYVVARDGEENPRIICDLGVDQVIRIATSILQSYLGPDLALTIAERCRTIEGMKQVHAEFHAPKKHISRELDERWAMLRECLDLLLQISIAGGEKLERDKKISPP